ncbi:major_cap_HK97, phage major capsid protein, HK97 family [uncultured Caudovirales phage]|uniref:Major_cap_HK97, phage major capsid protein, HK97 family n=1 Tax=uncultured Caudovirales phage TaxID=2100421 RepID=A0A6J5LK32_9CAUD|nr:major_cap_HK97, phage major capsid protein, HK97 family [uncultured Caudovirales phage]CAB4241989.1 major_cap_HK97, phage major capsid protein, HK97 family [uncultured Caudovirales phage]
MDKILEKLDLIEAQQSAEITKVSEAVATQVASVKEELTAEFAEKVAAIEAKVAQINVAPSILKLEHTVRGDVNKMVREQLREYRNSNGKIEKEIKLFEDESQYDAYLKEASALTAGGDNQGGRTAYDPVFVALRLANPLRGITRTVTTDGSSYQFRVKTGNSGAQWGYGIQNNGTPTTENTSIWQIVLKDLNVQFPIRTAALDDIDGLGSNVVDDMLAEFAQTEAQSMISNNDQTGSGSTVATGGADGVRGLDQYGGANSTYAGGTCSTASFGTSGTGSATGLHNLATYDQLTTNANTVGANNITYKDVVNFIYALPQQYWTSNAKFMISPILLQAIRGLTDTNGAPIFNRNEGLSAEGIVGQLMGFDVIVNKYLDTPSQTATGAAGTVSKYPMFFADWSRFHTTIDRLNMVLRQYDQTLPGYITYFGEKRLATSVRDPNAGVRYRSTGTAAA